MIDLRPEKQNWSIIFLAAAAVMFALHEKETSIINLLVAIWIKIPTKDR